MLENPRSRAAQCVSEISSKLADGQQLSLRLSKASPEVPPA